MTPQEALGKLREAIEGDRSPRWIEVIGVNGSDSFAYLNVEIEGQPFQLILQAL